MWICVDEAVGDDVIPAGRGSVGGMWELATWAEVDCRGELKGSAGISLSLGFPGWLRFYRRVAPTHSPLTAPLSLYDCLAQVRVLQDGGYGHLPHRREPAPALNGAERGGEVCYRP